MKTQLFFRRGLPNAKARHHNWHHVLAAWTFVPLMLIIFSGIVFSYGWANRLVYAPYGEVPGQPPRAAVEETINAPPTSPWQPAPLNTLAEQATDAFGNWQRLSIILPEPDASEVSMVVDWGNGVQTSKQRRVKLARDGSGIIGAPMASSASPGQNARRFLRFVHTGEIYGIIGQTIAGLASLASVILVYTGISLAVRRLVRMRRTAHR